MFTIVYSNFIATLLKDKKYGFGGLDKKKAKLNDKK